MENQTPTANADTKQKLGRTEQLIKAIRKTPIFRQNIPMEAPIALPIPLRKEGKLYLILPCYGALAKVNGEIPLYPPFATITVDWSTQTPVEYINLRLSNPAPELQWEEQVGTFPHDAIKNMKVKEYLKIRRELLGMYDEMFENLSAGNSFSQEWTERFRELLRILIEPSLEPYYRVLGSKFFGHFLDA
jgi:hypothetical protein